MTGHSLPLMRHLLVFNAVTQKLSVDQLPVGDVDGNQLIELEDATSYSESLGNTCQQIRMQASKPSQHLVF
ncbi:MAG: hypothetical protein R3C05_12520 [Pirellulaceae bacterium]